VFSTAWGEPIHPDTASSLMTKLINTHNDRQDEPLPRARLHDLRHVHATTLLLAGVPVHVVAARLGHADPSITLRVYAHVISDQLTEAADIFARAVAATSWRHQLTAALLATALANEPLPDSERGSDLGALGGTRTPNLLIRRSMESVRPVRRNPNPHVSVLLGVRHRRHSPVSSGQSVRNL
jgi:hypothetical protein